MLLRASPPLLLQIFFRMPGGNNVTIDVASQSTTVADLKKKLHARTNLPSTCQLFVYNGRPVRKDATVESMGVKHGSTIHVHLKWHGVGCACRSCTGRMLLRDGLFVPTGTSAESSLNPIKVGS